MELVQPGGDRDFSAASRRSRASSRELRRAGRRQGDGLRPLARRSRGGCATSACSTSTSRARAARRGSASRRSARRRGRRTRRARSARRSGTGASRRPRRVALLAPARASRRSSRRAAIATGLDVAKAIALGATRRGHRRPGAPGAGRRAGARARRRLPRRRRGRAPRRDAPHGQPRPARPPPRARAWSCGELAPVDRPALGPDKACAMRHAWYVCAAASLGARGSHDGEEGPRARGAATGRR